MPLLRLVAVILFVLGGLFAFNWFGGSSLGKIIGLDSFGLACLALSFLPIPSPPG